MGRRDRKRHMISVRTCYGDGNKRVLAPCERCEESYGMPKIQI